jgi:hypothetical protein
VIQTGIKKGITSHDSRIELFYDLRDEPAKNPTGHGEPEGCVAVSVWLDEI